MTEKVIALGEGITLSSDPQLMVDARRGSPQFEGLGFERVPPPPVFGEDVGVFESLGGPGGGSEPGLEVLEVSGVSDPSLVTPQNPLVLTLEESPLENELVMPYMFDGEFYLPLGNSQTVDGRTQIKIQQLPMPEADPALEALSSISIMFQKIASGFLGTEYNYPQLSAASVASDGKVYYKKDVAEVRRLVKRANRILLYVHGLFGASEGYVASSVAAEVKDGPAPKLADKYDLILAFDYESINTPIEWTARQLRWALEEVGLGPNHGKRLHIVAHSMGGLVSRWFIEMEGGHEMVQHLVTAGTPHLGSPWSKIHDLAGTLLSFGLNSLSIAAWPITVFSSLVKATESIDVTLDQMNPGSMFMKLLATNRNPGVPMTAFAGNTSIKPQAMQKGPGETSVLDRLLDRLEDMKLMQKAAGLAFFGKPNDMAVSVESAFGIPEGYSQTRTVEIPCDHMSFFLLSDSLRRMDEALVG